MDSPRVLLAQRKTSSQDPIGTTWLKKRRLGKCSMRLFCTSYRFLTKRSDSLFNQRQIHHALSCTSEPSSLSIMINFRRCPLWQRKGERLRLKWLWGSQDFTYSSPRSCFFFNFLCLASLHCKINYGDKSIRWLLDKNNVPSVVIGVSLPSKVVFVSLKP